MWRRRMADTIRSVVPTSRGREASRRPSLERQTTLYDDSYYADTYYGTEDQTDSYRGCDQTPVYSVDYYDATTGYGYQDDRLV
ncbi:unnamed protein product, partial [Timema podura]|nr:unnamed protein product [Timema podura]